MTVRRAVLLVAALGSAVMMTSAVATAQQTRPGAPPAGGYQQPPPPAAQQQQPNGGMPVQQPLPPADFQQTAYPEGYITDFPAAEVRAVPPAYVRAVVARAQLRRAISALDLGIRQVRRAFERSKDWVAALNDEREAWDAFQAARAKAMKQLDNDPNYLASIDLKKSVASQLAELHNDRYKSIDELMAMATVKMDYARTASEMESNTVAQDPDVQAARQRLRSAGMRVAELRAQLEESVRSNPEIRDAQRELDQAKIAHLATDAYFWAALDARKIALDYAYYLHRYDQYKYLSYGYHGYNYYPGYQVGYPVGYPYAGPWAPRY